MDFDPKVIASAAHRNEATARRWPRFHVDVRVTATIRSGGKIVTQHGLGNDLSRGGMAVYLACDLVVGEEINLELSLPYWTNPIAVTGAVRNRDGFKYGIEFTLISEVQQATIERTCSALALLQ